MIPYWLCRYLPFFDYLCPRCQKEVPKNSHECPSCGEKYPLPVRVPPNLLKNLDTPEGKKALERYVHKHVFPRISEFERNYLTKYFTMLFSDGFETNNFNAWSTTWTSGSGSLSVSSTQKHHGTYACRARFTGAGEAFPERTFGSPVDDTYVRVYVCWSTVPSNDGEDIYFIEAMNWDIFGNIMVGMRNNAGSLEWVLYDEYGSIRSSSVTPTISAVTWYCVELLVKTSGAVGEDGAWVWINSAAKLSWTGQTWAGGVATFRAGGRIYTGWTVDQYTDCVVVADTGPIGPEAAGPPLVTLVRVH